MEGFRGTAATAVWLEISRRYGYCLGPSRPDTAYGRHEPTSTQPWTDRCGRFMHCCPEGRPTDWLGRPPEADANALNEKIWHVLGTQTDAIASALAILARTQRSVCKCCNNTDGVPVQLEAWYATLDEAAGGASNADVSASYTSQESTRCTLGTKRVVPSVLELLKASCKTHTCPQGSNLDCFCREGCR